MNLHRIQHDAIQIAKLVPWDVYDGAGSLSLRRGDTIVSRKRMINSSDEIKMRVDKYQWWGYTKKQSAASGFGVGTPNILWLEWVFFRYSTGSICSH